MADRRVDELAALAELAERCIYDPLLWAELAWPWGDGDLAGEDIRVWQSEILDTLASRLSDPATRYQKHRIAVASGHGIGKSALMGMLTNWALSCWPGCRIRLTANTEPQLRTTTSPEIAKWFRSSLSAPLFDVDTMRIAAHDPKLKDRWRADFVTWSEHNTVAFQGLHNKGNLILILVDEGSEIPEVLYDVIDGAGTDEGTIVINVVFGNPTSNVGRFKDFFTHATISPLWQTWQIDSRTVEGTDKEYLDGLVAAHGDDSDYVRVRVKGQFPRASSRQFIPADTVEAARGKHLPPHAYNFAPSVLSCDPAWTGDDELVIGHRKGLMFEILDVIQSNDNDVEIAQRLAAHEDRLGAAMVFIDAGYGTGIVSAGKTMGRTWHLVWFGGKASDPGVVNKRTEMWRDTRDWLAEGGAIPDDNVLCNDLIAPETLPMLDGRVAIETKEHMRRRKIRSPDRGDALALTFAFPPPPVRHDTGYGTGPVVLNEEYNPYGV